MNPIYDVVILGCGEAGIFAAYELASHLPPQLPHCGGQSAGVHPLPRV